jgi:putative acetyltransferase
MNSNPDFEIRSMTEADFRPVAEIIASVKRQEFRAAEDFAALVEESIAGFRGSTLLPGSAFFIANRNGQVVGSGGVAPSRQLPPKICELQSVFLTAEARGRGIGEAIVRNCLTIARELGYRQCYLETLASMTAAQKVYAKCGFRSLPRSLKARSPAYLEHWMLIDL